MSRATVWRRGERAAERHLRRAGFRLIGRNVRMPIGEVDLLMRDPDGRTLVVVEVKARVTEDPSARLPERAITAAKARKLASLAASLHRRPRWRDAPIRVDVVAVEFAPRGRRPTEVRHYVSAVKAGGKRR